MNKRPHQPFNESDDSEYIKDMDAYERAEDDAFDRTRDEETDEPFTIFDSEENQ